MKFESLAKLDAPVRARIDVACNFVNQRIGRLRRRVLTIGLVAAVAALIGWAVTGVDLRIWAAGVFVVVLLAGAHAHRELNRWYKQMVIRRVVDALGNGLTYSYDSSFSKAHFHELDCFSTRADVWQSEDQVSGMCNHIAFTLHEVRAAKRERRGKNTHEVVFFKGHIVILEFNKNFHGHTVVVPDREGRILGGLFGEADSRRSKNLVHLANADFERVYTVYSTNDQEAHYLLTPKLMELVLHARAHLGDLRLAFFQNSLYVAIPSSHDRFEIGLFGGRVTPERVVGDFADVLALVEQLIQTLDLETRIWTRH